MGIGEAGLSPPPYSLISDYFEPEKRARAMSIYSMGIGGGIFLGYLVSGVVAEQYGWRAAFFVVGIPGVLLALLLKLTLTSTLLPTALGQSAPHHSAGYSLKRKTPITLDIQH